MAAVNTYKVHYYLETSGKKSSVDYYDYVQAVDSKETTIQAVLNTNSRPGSSATRHIYSIANVGPDLTASGVLA